MATQIWYGSARAIAQVTRWTFGGTWETDDLVLVAIGSKTLTVTAGSTTITAIIDAVVTAFNNLSATDWPEFGEITASRTGSDLYLTADVAGVPFTATVTTTEANGSAADSQTIGAATAVTASAGPNHWDTAANWSTGTVPVNSDNVFVTGDAPAILYGLNQSGVTLASLVIDASFQQTIGLPEYTGTYREYRERYLRVGATALKVGQGPGGGSSRLRISVGSVQTTADVYGTGASADTGLEALVLVGTHASNAVNVVKGSVGIATEPGQTATVATLRVGTADSAASDTSVRCGSGVTLTDIVHAGGKLEVNGAFTTLVQTDGEVTARGSGAATTLSIDGGTFYDQTTGTFTTLLLGDGGAYDRTRDARPKTITNLTLNSRASFDAPFGNVTPTNGYKFNRCTPADLKKFNPGTHLTLTPSAF